MNEYISKKKALAKFIEGDGEDDFTDGYNFAVSEYREKIKAMKSEDVQPVKRGKWEEEQYNDCLHCYSAICSECHCESTDFYSITHTHSFCEYCGARMDLKDGDIE